MLTSTTIDAISHVIGLSVAPVFLITGINSMLLILTSRLARIIDRARFLEKEYFDHVTRGTPSEAERVAETLRDLSQRALDLEKEQRSLPTTPTSHLQESLHDFLQRVRQLEKEPLLTQSLHPVNRNTHSTKESLLNLSRRARLTSRAIVLCILSDLLIASVVMTMFASAFIEFHVSVFVAIMFFLSLLSLVIGLLYFLREIMLASHFLRIGH